MTDGSMMEMHNPADMPDVMKIASIEEPWIRATIFVPDEFWGRCSRYVPNGAANRSS